LYFQEYARSIFEIEENKVEKGEKDGEKGGKENEYQQILEGTSSDEKSVSLSMELDLDSRNKSDDKGTLNILNENKSITNIKCYEVKGSSGGIKNKELNEVKYCRKGMEDMKGKGSCEDVTHKKDGGEREEKTDEQEQDEEEEEEGRIVERSQDIITPHQWQHFEPFFKWLDNPDKLPEV
jgi:hypothetical protein